MSNPKVKDKKYCDEIKSSITKKLSKKVFESEDFKSGVEGGKQGNEIYVVKINGISNPTELENFKEEININNKFPDFFPKILTSFACESPSSQRGGIYEGFTVMEKMEGNLSSYKFSNNTYRLKAIYILIHMMNDLLRKGIVCKFSGGLSDILYSSRNIEGKNTFYMKFVSFNTSNYSYFGKNITKEMIDGSSVSFFENIIKKLIC